MATKKISSKRAFELAKRGDTHAISALLFEHKNIIFAQLSDYDLWDYEDIEDVQLDLILRIIEAIPKFDISRLK